MMGAMGDDFVTVLWTTSWVEAEIAKGRLEAEGIQVDLPPIPTPQSWVPVRRSGREAPSSPLGIHDPTARDGTEARIHMP